MARDGERWREIAMEMAGDGGVWAVVAAGVAVCVGRRGQRCALAGAAEGAAAWWVKLLQSRYARASSYACTCARGGELLSGGEWR